MSAWRTSQAALVSWRANSRPTRSSGWNGDQAPPAYRANASRLLFSVERPYFRTATINQGVKS